MALKGPSGRVVITGIGAITPLGNSVDQFWKRMLAGESGIGPITCMETEGYTTTIAAEVKDFDPTLYVDPKEARRLDRFISFACAATKMALDDANFPLEDEELKLETGVMIGSGIGGLTLMTEQTKKLHLSGPSRVSPFLVPYMIPDMASGYTSIQFGLKGPNTCVVTACATGVNAIGDAYHIIKRGDATAMVAGGTEAPINPIGLAGFCAARAMTTNNEAGSKASRPFDANRDGFIMGEGAGVLILEDYEFAKARGAKIYAEIVGYGMSGDAYHITMPDPQGDGAFRSMKMAMEKAGISPSDVNYINAHGTSTPYNDKFETIAIKRAFGDAAYSIPVSSTKSSIGHLLGAAGAVESVICLLAMRDGVVPPTINYETPDPECDLDYIPNESRSVDVSVSMTNSFGFGGHNGTLVFRRED
ncbi:beta-ketoacyl-ACP synthase II [Kamptonema cortianum]|nr:beta-ketoacyl-ACP synthase II [Geitlerinema splendidum]MDK3156905.1 beta-ketoacyl-ACP synthase II [Kamptonema cortianum]